jgi:hypothetical protein
MSFELELRSCNLGKETKKIKNPFGSPDVEVPDDPGLTTSQRKAVRKLLDEVSGGKAQEQDYCDCDLQFPDGGSVVLYGTDPVVRHRSYCRRQVRKIIIRSLEALACRRTDVVRLESNRRHGSRFIGG